MGTEADTPQPIPVKEPEESDISSVPQEPAEPSTSGNETKLDEDEIHMLRGNEEGEIQVKIAEHEVLIDIKDCSKAISKHDGILKHAKVSQTTKDMQELEKTTLAISEEQILKEPNPNIQTEARIETGIIDVPLIQQDPITETF